ncbi:hypothetical protein C8R47DRAFT_1079629 [Mycena vitilis]|nr:hypothetical protein C8R47DRAFT_1079629 [Mycena vitilis]
MARRAPSAFEASKLAFLQWHARHYFAALEKWHLDKFYQDILTRYVFMFGYTPFNVRYDGLHGAEENEERLTEDKRVARQTLIRRIRRQMQGYFRMRSGRGQEWDD